MQFRKHSLLVILFLLGVAATGWAAQTGNPAYDEKAIANFYRNKTVRIVVGFTANIGHNHHQQ